jgi:Sec-independent protein translocase protein TatA
MGFHIVDILIVAAIGLALFGSKTLQSMAKDAGKVVGQAKNAKDKLMADVPLEEISKITNTMPQVPTNSRQAIQMLMKSEEKQEHSEKSSERVIASEASTEA